MLYFQVPNALGEDLSQVKGVKPAFSGRGAVDIMVTVWSVGSGLVTLAAVPGSVEASLKALRNWFGRESDPTFKLSVSGPSGRYEFDHLTTTLELDRAFEAIRSMQQLDDDSQ